MGFGKKILVSIFFLLSYFLTRLFFKYAMKYGEVFFKKKNPNALKFFLFYKKVVLFFVSYIIPFIILFVIISIWINN